MFRYSTNVITGYNIFWNDNNNDALKEFYPKILQVKDNSIQTKIHKMCVCSSEFVNEILGPYRNKSLLNDVSNTDIKKLTKQDFRKLYNELIKMFCIIEFTSKKVDIDKSYQALLNVLDIQKAELNISFDSKEKVESLINSKIKKAFEHIDFIAAEGLHTFFFLALAMHFHKVYSA